MRVTKIGGASVAEELPKIAAAMAKRSEPQVVVHGGGPQVTEAANRFGIPTRKIAGRRITDEATLDLILMVIGGLVHNRVVGTLVAAGAPAVGVAGPSVLRARRRPPIKVDGEWIDFGLVGEIVSVETGPIYAAFERGEIPVIPSIAGGADGALYNINADTAAAGVAVELGASELVLVTDSGGVRAVADQPSSLIEELGLEASRRLLADGVASGGMRPKLEAAIWALESGVARVRIVGAEAVGRPDGGSQQQLEI
jgi:acetylglutamate kinase